MLSDLPREVIIDPGAPESRRIPRFFLYLLGVPLLCVATCAACYWFVELRPQYAELNVPPSEEMYRWDYTARSVLEWRDGPRSFLWRQDGDWFASEGQDWHTIWSYFDNALTKLGWVRVDERFGTPCGPAMPETEFLKLGDGGYVIYVQQQRQDRDENVFCHGPDVCLAIWQQSPGFFRIVLASDNPSPLTEWGHCMG